MIAEVTVMDEITKVEGIGKKEMRVKGRIKDTSLTKQKESEESMKKKKKEKP